MSLFRKFILVNSSEFICLGIAVFRTAILARVLGPAGIGQYAITISTLSLAPLIFGLGIPISFLYHSQHDPENKKRYLMHSLCATLFLGVIGGLGISLLIFFKSDYFGILPLLALIVVGSYVPIFLLRAVTRSALLIRIEAFRLAVVRIISMVLGILLVLILFLVGTLTISWAIVSLIFIDFVALVLGFFWIRTYMDFSINLNWAIVRKLSFMGIRLNWVNLMALINAQLNIFLLKYLMDNFESVGYFSRAQRIAMLGVISCQAVMPLLFSRWAAFPEQNLTAHVEKVLRFASTVSMITIGGVLLTGKWLILILYGQRFLPAVDSLMILVPGTVLYLISMILMQLLNSRGHPELTVVSLVIASAINAVLCWFFIPIAGIVGAAWASTTGNIVLLLLLASIVMKKYGIRIANCIWVSRSDINGVMGNLLHRKS